MNNEDEFYEDDLEENFEDEKPKEEEINNNGKKKRVKARKLKFNEVFQKEGKIRKKMELAKDIEENLLFLITTDGKVKIYDGIASGYVEMKRTDEEDATLVLDSGKLLDFEYGNASVRGWIHYEDEASSYPHSVENDSVIFRKLISKMILNVENYKAKRIDAWGSTIFKILIGIMLILGVLGLYVLPNLDSLMTMASQEPETTKQAVEIVNKSINESVRKLSKTVIPA